MTEEEYKEYVLVNQVFFGLMAAFGLCAFLFGCYAIGKCVYDSCAQRAETRVAPAPAANATAVVPSDSESVSTQMSTTEVIGDSVQSPAEV